MNSCVRLFQVRIQLTVATYDAATMHMHCKQISTWAKHSFAHDTMLNEMARTDLTISHQFPCWFEKCLRDADKCGVMQDQYQFVHAHACNCVNVLSIHQCGIWQASALASIAGIRLSTSASRSSCLLTMSGSPRVKRGMHAAAAPAHAKVPQSPIVQ